MEFPEKLQSLRKGKNLSQEQFAEIMNVSRQAVSKWELGQAYPDIDKLVEISNYFGVSLDCLLKKGQPENEMSNDKDCISNKEQEKAAEKDLVNNEEYIPKSRIRRKIAFALITTCFIICIFELGRLRYYRDSYQIIYHGVMSIIGIAASIYVAIKIKRGKNLA